MSNKSLTPTEIAERLRLLGMEGLGGDFYIETIKTETGSDRVTDLVFTESGIEKFMALTAMRMED